MNQPNHKLSVPSHIQRHFAAQKQSGLSIRAYCEKHSVSLSTFHYWRKRYRLPRNRQMESKSKAGFVDMGILELNSRVCEVHFPSGLKVTMHPGTTPEQLGSLLRAVAELGQC